MSFSPIKPVSVAIVATNIDDGLRTRSRDEAPAILSAAVVALVGCAVFSYLAVKPEIMGMSMRAGDAGAALGTTPTRVEILAWAIPVAFAAAMAALAVRALLRTPRAS